MNAKQIKELRNSLDLTQGEFAKKVDVNINTIVNWEKGKSEPREGAMEKLKALAAKAKGKAGKNDAEETKPTGKRRGRPPGSGKKSKVAAAPPESGELPTGAPAPTPTSVRGATGGATSAWAGIGKFARTIGQLVKSDGLDPSQLEQMLGILQEAHSSGMTLPNLIDLLKAMTQDAPATANGTSTASGINLDEEDDLPTGTPAAAGKSASA